MGGKSKKITVGYRYKMGLHFCLCRGPVDSVDEIIIGERTAWKGPVEDSALVYINKPDLFGGDKREGGILGYASILFGWNDQPQQSYLLSKLGDPLSAFRGVVSVVFNGGRVTSNNPYVKPWWFRVERIETTGDGETAQWYVEKAPISLADEGDSTLIGTYSIDIDYVANAGTNANNMKAVAGADISGLQTTDTVVLTVNYDGPYIAGSMWGVPALGGSNTGSSYLFHVVKEDQSSATEYEYGGPYDGYVAARDAFVAAQPVVLTGATRYRFGLIDTPIGDNTGGLSMTARVYRSLSYRAMNPAHILRECLTDPYMRMAYPTSMIDDAAWTAAADTFYNEGMGLCLHWSQQTQIKDFIQLVLDHCGAVYYADPYTGLFVLTPLRGDYNPASLDIYDESSIIDVESYDRAGPGEVINEITVVYTDIVTGNPAAVTIQDNAAIQSQGYIVSQTKQYPGIATATLANRVAQRDLLAVSQPLAKLKVKFTREAWPLRPGGVIKVSWAKLGISELICRVLSIDYGLLEDGAIMVDLAEDVFGLPTTSFQAEQPSGWEAPNDEPAVITIQDLVEAPYWDIATNFSAADLAYVDADAGYVFTLAAGTSSMQLGYNIYTRIDPAEYEQRETGPMAPTAVLYDNLERSDSIVHLTTLINFDATTAEVGDRIMIGTGRDAEFCEITDLTDVDMGLIVVNRGILDTTPGRHAAGTRVWLYDDNFGNEGIERATYDVIDARLTAFTGTGEGVFGNAVEMSITMDSRFDRPYPPGNVTIDGDHWPYGDVLAGFVIDWAHRDRLQQTATYISQDEASIGPEAGTTYNIYLIDDISNTVVYSALNVNDDTYLMPAVNGVFQARLELEAERDGIVSWQRQVREFYYIGSLPLMGALLLKSTTTAPTINATTTMSWDTELDDDGGFFTSGAPTIFTVPEDGWYFASFDHVVDAGASSWGLESKIVHDGVSGVGDSGSYWRSVLTTVDQGRCVFALDRFVAGGTLTAQLIRSNTGSGTPTIEANPTFNIVRCYSSPVLGAVVTRVTNLSVGAATDVTVTFTAEALDDGGMFDLAGAPTKLIVPVGGAGWYAILANCRWASSGTASHRTVYLRVNGVNVSLNQLVVGALTQTHALQCFGLWYLEEGDEVTYIVRTGTATTITAATLSACRIGIGAAKGAALSRSTAQTANIGSTTINWDTVHADTGDMFDAAVNDERIYAKVDGYYAIFATTTGSTTGAGASKYTVIRKNGSIELCRSGIDTPAAASGVMNPGIVAYLREGDYVDVVFTTTINTTAATCRFTMVLVSAEEESS